MKIMAVWIGEETAKCFEQPPEVRIQPNGVDLKISEVWKLPESGIVRIHGQIRTIQPEKTLIKPEKDGFYYLLKGTYEIRIANKLNIPDNAIGFIFPRSTFNRLGVIKSETAVCDSGYSGFCTQTVFVTVGELQVYKDEHWFQFVVMDTKEPVKQKYQGNYQGEKPKD